MCARASVRLCVYVRAGLCSRRKTGVVIGVGGGGGLQKMIRGPIHMKQEGSYINIAPRPRGQAIYEANCSPVSHGGRAVYYA